MIAYQIRDAAGNLAAIHERHDDPDGKRYTWRSPDGSLGLNGTPVADLPLYGVDRLGAESIVVLVEGEKSADALAAVGIPAVATVTGAAATPGPAALAELTGRSVAVWADADDVGYEHMRRVIIGLERVGAASVRMIDWPGAPEHGDAADFLAAGGTAADVEALILLARELPIMASRAEPVAEPAAVRHSLITPMADFLAEDDVATLDVVPGIIPADGFLLWVGRKESFKSMSAQTLHAAVGTAGEWLGMPVLPMRSVYVSNEKRRRSVRERFRSIIGVAEIHHEIGIVHRTGLVLDPAADRWRRFVDEIDAMNERVMVTLDTLTSLAPPGFKENNPEAMGTVLAAVRMLTSLPSPATVNLLHHPAWADQAGKEMRGRGHSSLDGEHDGMLSFSRPDRAKDDAVIHVRPKDGDYRLLLIAWDRDTMRIVRRDILGMPLTVSTAVDIIREGLGGTATVDQVRTALGFDVLTGKPRFSDDRVRTVLNDAVMAHELSAAGGKGGAERIYTITESDEEL